MELPPYISWSRIRTFKQSPNEYYRRYVLGEEIYETKYLKYGKEFANAVENGGSDDEIIDEMVQQVTTYDDVEKKMRAEIDDESYNIPVPLFGYIDTYKDGAFREYKTGKSEWTQYKVDNHGQLLMYATLTWLNTGVVPDIHLDWLPTTEQNGNLRFTGEIYTYERNITEDEIKDFLVDIENVIGEMEEYQPKDEASIDELEEDEKNLLIRYMQVNDSIDNLKDQKYELENQIQEMFADNTIRKVNSEVGSFYQRKNKSYSYPQEIEELRSELNQKRKEARDNGEVEVNESTSLVFKKN